MLGSKNRWIGLICHRLPCPMLVPLTRDTFDNLIPRIATVDQYRYYWGKPSDLLRRVLISVLGVLIVFLLRLFFGEAFESLAFILATILGLYWFWSPVYWASQRNREGRRNSYSGYWRGRVLDVFVTDEIIGTEETVNARGELVIVENRERRLNLEVGDKTGFTAHTQVPLKRDHRLIRPGDLAEMIVMSNRPDLSRITMISDIYIADHKLWISDYPYLRKDAFLEVSRRIERQRRQRQSPPPPSAPAWK